MSAWWAAELEQHLSQGDVISEMIVPVLDEHTYLRKEAVPKVGPVWLEGPWTPNPHTGMGHYLGRGKRLGALVLNHSCELDKLTGKHRVLVATIAPISAVTDKVAAENIMAQRRVSALPLPDVPGLGDCYADLRVIGAVQRSTIDQKRIASMTPEAIKRLQLQLIAFFARVGLPEDGG